MGGVSCRRHERRKTTHTIMRVLVVLSGSCFLAVSAAAPPDTPPDTIKELLDLQHQWADARVRRDVAFLEKFYAQEFRITSMNGAVVSRSEDIGVFASGDMRPESVIDEDMEVLIYDEVAVITGLEKVRGTYKGRAGNFDLRFTNVLVRRDGRWQLVTHQSTEVRRR